MSTADRFHALDAVRGFALLLGVVFHAGFSFLPGLVPGIWAIVDTSPSRAVAVALFASHMFRMSLFFFIAGFFARMAFVRRGARGFAADRAKRILLPLVGGWLVLFPLLAAVWLWGLTKTFGGTLPAPPAGGPPAPPGAFPLTHLWFLYYLLVLYALLFAARRLAVALDGRGRLRAAADRMVRALVETRTAAVLLPLPLAAALYLRPDWILWFGIPTPDGSLLPQAASLVGYGTAIAFGWLVHRQTDLLDRWGRQWGFHLAGAALLTGSCLAIAGLAPVLVPAAAGPMKAFYALGYGVALWCWTFAIVGAAVRFANRPNPGVRYLADASYWIYLAHLPVVAALQVMVGHLPWHWSVKLPLILAVSMAALLGSYHYLVRSTVVGEVLNGRRHPRRARSAPADLATPPAASPVAAAAEPIAALRGAHKRYGSTTALDGLDLEVRAGELLAVLGPNGAGKSTAISLWLGLLQPDRGTVHLFGGSPLDVARRRRTGVMMQDVGLTPDLRVRELIDLTASYYEHPLSTPETLRLARLEALAARHYGKLSAGQKRMVQFAMAVCGRPSLLFLDEPSVGLDVEAREAMWATIRGMVREGCAVVLTTHYLEEAEALADRVAVMAAGRLVATGTVAEVRSIVGRKRIACSTILPVERVLAWPGVVAARRDRQRLEITAVDAEAVVRRLLAGDGALCDLEVRQAGLAEAFTKLTMEAA